MSEAQAAYLRVKDFGRLQHYKDRNPPWIKLYNSLLDDYAFGCLPDASKWLAIGITLLASRYENQVPADAEWIARRINANTHPDLDALVSAGFIEMYQGASSALATRADSAMPEVETETEGKGETTKNAFANANGAGAPSSAQQNGRKNPRKGRRSEPGNAELLGIIRQRFYAPDGNPPEGYTVGREISIIRQLRKQNKSNDEIANAIEGLARIRDADGRVGDEQLATPRRDEKLTMRLLFNTTSGIRPMWSLAEQKLAETAKNSVGTHQPAKAVTSVQDILRTLDAQTHSKAKRT